MGGSGVGCWPVAPSNPAAAAAAAIDAAEPGPCKWLVSFVGVVGVEDELFPN